MRNLLFAMVCGLVLLFGSESYGGPLIQEGEIRLTRVVCKEAGVHAMASAFTISESESNTAPEAVSQKLLRSSCFPSNAYSLNP